MDIVVCNSLGIWLGMKTLDYLSWKKYSWRGIWNIPSYREKLQRLAAQFTPYSWTDFQWKPTLSLKRWLAMLCVIVMVSGTIPWHVVGTTSYCVCGGDNFILYVWWGQLTIVCGWFGQLLIASVVVWTKIIP